jgi:hypothetical protein
VPEAHFLVAYFKRLHIAQTQHSTNMYHPPFFRPRDIIGMTFPLANKVCSVVNNNANVDLSACVSISEGQSCNQACHSGTPNGTVGVGNFRTVLLAYCCFLKRLLFIFLKPIASCLYDNNSDAARMILQPKSRLAALLRCHVAYYCGYRVLLIMLSRLFLPIIFYNFQSPALSLRFPGRVHVKRLLGGRLYSEYNRFRR